MASVDAFDAARHRCSVAGVGVATTERMRMGEWTGRLVDHPALKSVWWPVARAADLHHGPLGRRVLDTPLVLWRDSGGSVVAAPDQCPHRHAPLSAGSVDDGVLACCYHGWRFGSGGRCVGVPSSRAGVPTPPAAHLRVLPLAERYGLIWVTLDEPDAGRPIPTVAEDDDPMFRRIDNPVEEWATSATRMVDNFLDIAHFPYVHTATFGTDQETAVGEIVIERLDGGYVGYRYEVVVDNPDDAAATTLAATDTVRRTMTTGFRLPFTVRSTIRYETGLEHVILLLTTPITDDRSYFTFVVWRNDDFSVPADEVVAFDRAIGAEDRAMLERIPGALPLAPAATVSVQADKASVEWRRRLAEMLD